MDDSIGLLLLFQLVLIMLNAIFASAEIAVLSISETKLEHMADDGNGRAIRSEIPSLFSQAGWGLDSPVR